MIFSNSHIGSGPNRGVRSIMKSRNVIGGTSGPRVVCWKEVAPERIIPSLLFGSGADVPSVFEVRQSVVMAAFGQALLLEGPTRLGGL